MGKSICRCSHRFVMPGENGGARFLQPFDLFLKILRVFVGADDRGDDRQAPSIAAGSCDRLGDGRRQLFCRVGMRAVA